ncbi:MAG: hypothetical protein RSH24_19070 [Flavobacterium sp.]
MRKILLLTTVFALFSCNNEIDDILNDYKTKPKSADLQGFWQLEGVYPPDSLKRDKEIGISQGWVGIGPDEILYLDNEYLRFLNKSTDEDSLYHYNKKDRLYWYNNDKFIKSVYEESYNTKDFQNITEYQIPFKFGGSKDTLVVQSNHKTLYLIKRSNIKFTEYVFD